MIDSGNFTKEQLDAIVTAFYDVADVIDSNDFESETGLSDSVSKDNFVKARALVYATD